MAAPLTVMCLSGANGIHSVVREYVAGPDRPIWSGMYAWRGLAPAALGHHLELELRHHSFWGPRQQFVTFYVSSGRLVNWVGIVHGEGDWREESWSALGDREQALADFAAWHPQVRALIAGTDEIFKWALFDRLPLYTWARGRVTLLGDAAHPMLPFLAQGASQSIEDGYVLGRCFSAGRDAPEEAIRAYVGHRRERTAAIQTAAREQARMVHLTDTTDIAARNARLADSANAYTARWHWIYGYDMDRIGVEAGVARAAGVPRSDQST
jgi:2-polyprenyl-6-methoxyphenol hydroxylase-like FAD-dependent oxidoreductase